MTKVGFICEGATERKIVESNNTRNLLTSLHIELIEPIIDATGKTNLSRNKIDPHIQRLKANGAEKIVVLTDRDGDCITTTKEAIGTDKVDLIVVAVKQIEAWFLADSECMTTICNTEINYDTPEEPAMPFDVIKELLIQHTSRGVGGKTLLAAKCIGNGFSIAKAAQHPQCSSAKYFVSKLAEFYVEH